MKDMTARIRYFDIAKGIAILAVVLSHSVLALGIPNIRHGTLAFAIYAICFSFHMPLFFILSGYFMHPDRPFRWRKESRELLATYAITSLAIVAINTVVAAFQHGDVKTVFANWLSAVVYGAGATDDRTLWPIPVAVGAIWFLLALFWAHLFLHVATRFRATPLWVVLLFVIGYFSAKYVWLPFSIQSGMTTTAFVYLGYLARKYDLIAFLGQHIYLWIIPALIWIVAVWKFGGYSVAMNQYGPYPALAFIGSIAGTLCVVGLSMLIDHAISYLNRFLAFVGQYTLPLLCVHLLEIDVLPWPLIVNWLTVLVNGHGTPYIIFIVRLVCDAIVVFGMYYIPKINTIFFPSLVSQKQPRKAS